MVTLVKPPTSAEPPRATEGEVLAGLVVQLRSGALRLAEDSPLRADLLVAADRYQLLATIRGADVPLRDASLRDASLREAR